MDTSETYIKMSDCEEIQALCQYKYGDVIYDGDGIEVIGSIIKISDTAATQGGYDYDFYDYIFSRAIWLPRQDQLQEMLGFHSNEAMLFMFHEFTCTPVHNVINFVWHHHKSMEQLWLAFYMVVKHGKYWTGEAWKHHEATPD